ncbi:MAG: haloacid dehalogenase type II, partial [Alphaproteobacteria bacterium]|nr:haloacid dehalogenase type II [Alphaproteobacteria bacterium]
MTIQDEIKALAFDVGGTVLDWHSGISAAARAACEAAAPDTDWPALANRWRLLQLQGMLGESMNGKTPDRFRGMNIDGVSRAVLDQVLEEFGLTQLDPAARDELSAAWHRLPAWPDSAPGHARLRRKFLMSTLTILSVSLIVDVSRLAPFLWDCVISCEMLGIYKTNPLVYRRGAELLNL